MYDQIINNAIEVKISMRDVNRIDEINILNATKESMKECFSSLKNKADLLLIDAVKLDICENEMPIVKGDATSYAIASASIVAKVYRDRIMEKYAKTYPNYDFENNVGYGTAKHIQSIKQFGITPIHRLSFLKNILGERECELEEIKRERDKNAG